MAVIHGKIQPLKKLKETLNQRGIFRFNSVGDINVFLKNFEVEKRDIPKTEKEKLDSEIKGLDESIKQLTEKANRNAFFKFYYGFKKRKIFGKKESLENNYDNIFSDRCKNSTKYLINIKEIVEELNPLIAGAVGENKVVNELKKLPDSFYIINDFCVEFNPPIFNRSENDRIFSIQVDHLLICRSGVYVLETKNWSEKSLQNLDLRSPVQQIQRTSYALFIALNSESDFGLNSHHWGSKKIPIKNIIVMINNVPIEEFKHVKILKLSNLNNYLRYFDDIFSDDEVKNIFDILK